MKDLLRPEAPFSIIVLLVCLPVAATLVYIAGYSFVEMLSHPREHPLLFGVGVLYLIMLVRAGLAVLRENKRAKRLPEEGEY